jgi:hypothetical protein
MYKYMINIENIFPLFPSNHDDSDISQYDNAALLDIKESPVYFIGMYKKLVLNHINFNKKVLQMFKSMNGEFDIKDVKEAGEHITYNKAWSYIKNIDISIDEHIDAIQYYTDEYLQTSLELGISFFIETEEYEKCALLNKILEISRKF